MKDIELEGIIREYMYNVSNYNRPANVETMT